MSRAVHISYGRETEEQLRNGGKVVATGIFDVIVEGTRKQFAPDEEHCMRSCFEDLDELFQEYISIADVDEKCFKAFVRACEAGLELFEATGATPWNTKLDISCTELVSREWQDLINMLHADPRWVVRRSGDR